MPALGSMQTAIYSFGAAAEEQTLIKIAFDHQIFSFQRFGGVSRVFARLIEELQSMPGIRVRLPFLCTRNAYLRTSSVPGIRRPLDRLGLRLSRRRANRINNRTQTAYLKWGDFDVFHPTYYSRDFLDALDGQPFVLTVVDMIPEIFPAMYDSSPHLDKHDLISKASAIICISETTRRDLLRFHDVSPEYVYVAHLGAPERTLLQGAAPPLPDNYVLFVGNRWTYKNFARFADAMRLIMRRRSSLHLVCAGGGPLSPDELQPFLDAGCHDRVQSLAPNDQALAGLYRKASVFVFPSLYEGFGLPVLEAFAFGCPAVLGDTDSFREVAQDAALYFDPLDPAAMAEGINRLLGDATLRQRLIAKGAKRVMDFSWRRMAEETAAVYADVARGQ